MSPYFQNDGNIDPSFSINEHGFTRGRVPNTEILAALILHAFLFVVFHKVSAAWGEGSLFTLWYPPVGARLAFLWRYGPRFGLLAPLVELAVHYPLGTFPGGSVSTDLLFTMSVVGAPLAYLMVVEGAKHLARTQKLMPPLPLAAAILIAPMVAAFSSLFWWVLIGLSHGQNIHPKLFFESYGLAAARFLVGDYIGLLTAGPIVFLLISPWQASAIARIRASELIGPLVTNFVAWSCTILLSTMTSRPIYLPLIVSIAWTAVSCGRWTAWAFAMVNTGIAMAAAFNYDSGLQFIVHLQIAIMLLTGVLLGSLVNAQQLLRNQLEERNRALFHHERLDMLRSMSLALIHEASQPLSTLTIEARQMERLARDPEPNRQDLLEASSAIARQTSRLSALVSRLREFGSRGSDTPARFPMKLALDEVVALAAREAAEANVDLVVSVDETLEACGHRIEIEQAVLNLVRNAITASAPGSAVRLSGRIDQRRFAIFSVEDDAPPRSGQQREGMGIGLNIVQAIAQANRGTLSHRTRNPSGSCYDLCIPLPEDTAGGPT